MKKIKLIIAESFKERLLGLIPYKCLFPDEVMLIKRCRSIHTFFMRFTIDVMFADEQGNILKYRENMKPGGICFGPLKTKEVFEAKAGFIKRFSISINDNIQNKFEIKNMRYK